MSLRRSGAGVGAKIDLSNQPFRALHGWAGAVLFCASLTLTNAQSHHLPPDLSDDPEARGFADLLFAQGMVALSDGDCESALVRFEKAAQTYPADATFVYFAGLCHLRLQFPADAIESLQRALPPAVSRVPEARVRQTLGRAFRLAGNSRAALRELQAAVDLDPQDGSSHFHLGIVLFARQETEAAVAAFERAVALDPALRGDGSYFLGIAAHRAGDRETAGRHFETAAASAAAADLRDSSRNWLQAMAAPAAGPPPPPRTEIRVGLTVASDDNPGRIDDTLPGLSGAESDQRAEWQLRAAWQPMVQSDGWTIGMVFNGYGSRHNDFDPADLAGAQGLLQAAWGSDPLGYVNGPLGYARVTPGQTRFGWIVQAGGSWFALDGQSHSRDYQLTGSFLVRQFGFGKTQVDLHFDDRTFFDPGFQVLSGAVRSARIGQYFEIGGRSDRYLRVAVGQSETSTRYSGTDFDTIEILAELALPVSRRWTLFLNGARSEDDYEADSALLYGTVREDDHRELAATAVAMLGRNAYLTFRYQWADHEVDPASALLSYDRRIGSAGITWYW